MPAFSVMPWMLSKIEILQAKYPFLTIGSAQEFDGGRAVGVIVVFGDWQRAFRMTEDEDVDAKVAQLKASVIKVRQGEYAGATPERTARIDDALLRWSNDSPHGKAWLSC